MNNKFIHCHVHSIYSMLDGYSKIDDLIEKAIEYNMSSIYVVLNLANILIFIAA